MAYDDRDTIVVSGEDAIEPQENVSEYSLPLSVPDQGLDDGSHPIVDQLPDASASPLAQQETSTASTSKGIKKAKSKKRVVVKKAARRSKWNQDNILTDPKSPLASADLRSILSNPMAWEILENEERAEILALFPDSQHILSAGTEDACPDFASLMNDDSFRYDCAAYTENIAQGRHDPEWLAQAWAAHERRKMGDFDEHLDNKFKDDWDVNLPPELKTTRSPIVSKEENDVKMEGTEHMANGNEDQAEASMTNGTDTLNEQNPELGKDARINLKSLEYSVCHGVSKPLQRFSQYLELFGVGHILIQLCFDPVKERYPEGIVDSRKLVKGCDDGLLSLNILWWKEREEVFHNSLKDVPHYLCRYITYAVHGYVVFIDAPEQVDCLDDIEDFGPDDELSKALDKQAKCEMKGIVDDGPELLAELWEVRVLHPVKVDKEHNVDGGSRGENNTHGFSICCRGILNNSDNAFANGDDSVANDNDGQKTHALHQMCSLEAENWEDVCQCKCEDNLDNSKDVPCDVDVTIVVGEAECGTEIDHGEDKVQSDLKQHRQGLLLELADMPEYTRILDGQG
ncbi:hypothetical protein HG531_006219 [Fusarium graminearum]|nr:hypothetical protein HG531_006219 [Fusarium graminearum]